VIDEIRQSQIHHGGFQIGHAVLNAPAPVQHLGVELGVDGLKTGVWINAKGRREVSGRDRVADLTRDLGDLVAPQTSLLTIQGRAPFQGLCERVGTRQRFQNPVERASSLSGSARASSLAACWACSRVSTSGRSRRLATSSQ